MLTKSTMKAVAATLVAIALINKVPALAPIKNLLA